MGEVVEMVKFAEKPRQKITADALLITSFSEAKRIFLLHCRAKNLSPRTIPWYEKKLGYFEKFLREVFPEASLPSVMPAMIKDYICWLQGKEHERKKGETLSSYTVAGMVRALKVFFHFLSEESYLPSNPSEKIKVPKIQKRVVRALSDEELRKLFAVYDTKTFAGFRNSLILTLFLDTGMRLSELVNLKVKDVDHERYTMRILGKGNKEREVPFGMRAARALVKYLKWRGDIPGQEFVFVDKFKQKMKLRQIQKIVERAARKAGVERVHCHRFRHTFALNWVKLGGDAFSLQRILGHTSLDMVRNYVNLAGEDVVMKHRQFGMMDKLELGKN